MNRFQVRMRVDQCETCGATVDGGNGRTYVDRVTEEPTAMGIPALHEHWVCRVDGSSWTVTYQATNVQVTKKGASRLAPVMMTGTDQ